MSWTACQHICLTVPHRQSLVTETFEWYWIVIDESENVCSGLREQPKNKKKFVPNSKGTKCSCVTLKRLLACSAVRKCCFGSVLQSIRFEIKTTTMRWRCWLSASNNVWGCKHPHWVNSVRFTFPLPPNYRTMQQENDLKNSAQATKEILIAKYCQWWLIKSLDLDPFNHVFYFWIPDWWHKVPKTSKTCRQLQCSLAEWQHWLQKICKAIE